MTLCLRQVKVLFSTCVDMSRIASHSKVIQRLGGQVVDGDASDFTHFVSLPPRTGQSKKDKEDRGFKKSINSLIALAAGMFLIYQTLLLKLQLPCFIAWTASCSCLCTPLLLTGQDDQYMRFWGAAHTQHSLLHSMLLAYHVLSVYWFWINAYV